MESRMRCNAGVLVCNPDLPVDGVQPACTWPAICTQICTIETQCGLYSVRSLLDMYACTV